MVEQSSTHRRHQCLGPVCGTELLVDVGDVRLGGRLAHEETGSDLDRLQPLGQEAEYERRHRPIWPELESVLKEHGVDRYSIFLDPSDGSLFAYVEIEDEARWDAIASTPECRRWWRHMRDVMPSHPDDSPVSAELSEVFHMH